MSRFLGAVCFLILALLIGQTGPSLPTFGQTSETKPKPPAMAAWDQAVAGVTQALQGKDAGKQANAVAEIHRLMGEDAGRARKNFDRWIDLLLLAKRYEDAEALAGESILASASSLPTVEKWQTIRVRALLALGKNAEAAAQAKSLFNVASMRGTGQALLMIRQCLAAGHEDVGEQAQPAENFRREQIAAAREPKKGLVQRSAVMDGITVDAKFYEAAIAAAGPDYDSLCAKGNLLLLADRGKEAREVFDEAYTLASEMNLPSASENIARAIKAEDGTIGRANAWALSLWPKAEVKAAGEGTP